jgi:hypothetical protein
LRAAEDAEALKPSSPTSAAIGAASMGGRGRASCWPCPRRSSALHSESRR